MLIVSKALLSGTHVKGAWQGGSERNRDTHVLVRNNTSAFRIVQGSVNKSATFLQIGTKGFDELLVAWAQCSEVERKVWEEGNQAGKVNGPIFDSDSWKARGGAGQRADVLVYDNAYDMVLALFGTIRSARNKEREVEYGRKIYECSTIRQNVLSVCRKVIIGVEAMKDYTADHRNTIILKGDYKRFHSYSGWDKWKREFWGATIRANIAVLHDIYDFFDKAWRMPGPWQSEQAKGALTPSLPRRLFKTKTTMRHNVGTVNEDEDWTARARWADVPVWAGPSGTTYGLCSMLDAFGGATPDEFVSCAYALFALWATDYPQTATPIHHLFGVVTGASEFLNNEIWGPFSRAESMYAFLARYAGFPISKL